MVVKQHNIFGGIDEIDSGNQPKHEPGHDIRQGANPLIATYGPGPVGKHCKSCNSLIQFSMGKTWYKCQRRFSPNKGWGGIRTDHLVSWWACGKYAEK